VQVSAQAVQVDGDTLVGRMVWCPVNDVWPCGAERAIQRDRDLVLPFAETRCQQELDKLKTHWHPKHPDLQNLPIVSSEQFETLTAEQKALCLVVHAPADLHRSLTLMAYGIIPLLQNYEAFPHSEPAQTFLADFRKLSALLQQNGFQIYRTPNEEIAFEKRDYFQSMLAASREEFVVKGTQKYAFLELFDLEQRLLVENRIETKIHEDLIKWRDDYNAAQVSIHPGARFDVPKPVRSVFWNNIVLSAAKFFRGDERKVIRWGLDLSGGKTVQIELRDANQQLVTDEDDLRQGINELYNRVNKMGVSEVVIRQLGNHIVLDFPGSQSLSAAELIKASSMYFHVVNEKFSSPHSPHATLVHRFLTDVWNEAIVTNRKDAQGVNAIAWNHLHSGSLSETARTLLENGLVLQSPHEPSMDGALNESVSKIAVLRGEGHGHEWQGQGHPLLIVFNNYTLEGSQLARVQSNYDPQKGNYLSFDVQKGDAQTGLQSWTSRFSKERILGTPLEEYSKGRGWRMAVVLNDTVISAPTLDAVIRDSASISGSFSQREVTQLVSDLKAGSLTFTPHILSEKNVSPELGQKDRVQGITATVVALLLVIGSMIAYYRFAGLVASVAVLFNLLILWATWQNIGATLSLAGIAGIILTVGMAVDANVLVFERVKEEFAHSGRLASAIAAGYKKAYTAIVDSNVTTIIAALILLNFDAGPIKGFAMTLIIGIVSSMFTALFMTRYYFSGWIKNPKHTVLTMANWIHAKSIDFLKQAKLAFAIAAAIILIGGYFVYAQRTTIFGMDFTGGFSLYLEVEPRPEGNYLATLEKTLLDQGATARDFQIRELNPPNHLRVLFGTSMEQPGKPFHSMPLETDRHTNPRIEWVSHAIQASGLTLSPTAQEKLASNWTAMSGQMSDSMRNNALIGLLLSFICIFIYITLRFEYKFAAASIICLLHDVLITIGLMGLLHAIGVPVQIDLNTIAAIMTIVGYSLNDTIIIFDRIREEMHVSRNKPLSQIVNSALNTTLSRTTITSGTTLLVLIALVALGGSTIFSFALVMTIGVFFGTLSSWYIASPLMLFFHRREERALANLPS
jgi:SecD/SecF fusion protein